MENLFKKPSILQMTLGLTVSIVKSIFVQQKISPPQKIGKYHLIQEIKKENEFKESAIGIYKYKNQKVFIKTWQGTLKDFRYFILLNEYLINGFIFNKLLSYEHYSGKKGVKVPKLVDLIVTKNSLSLVFEYIEGKTLTNYSYHKKVKILSEVLSCLIYISGQLTNKERNQLPKRSLFFYFLTLPCFAILTVLSNPRSFKIILKALIGFLSVSKSIKKTDLIIAHRDINLHNILISGKDIYVLDWGRVVLTLPNYDITHLSLFPNLESVTKLVSKKMNLEINQFLKYYISIHLSKSYENPREFGNFYLKYLYGQYS